MAKMNIPMGEGRSIGDADEHETVMVKKAEEADITFRRTDKDSNTVVVTKSEGEQSTNTEENKSTKPDHVPDKFWDAEKGTINVDALLKSYIELESARSKQSQNSSRDDGAGVDQNKGDAPGKVVSSFDELRAAAEAEFADTGALSEETYAALEKTGFSRAMVDQYIAGAKAQTDAQVDVVFRAAGVDADQYDKLVKWASENLSPEEISSYNNALVNTDSAIFAVKGLLARYRNEADVEPDNYITGGSGPISVYKSRAEMMEDMRSPKYKTDPAFRHEVAAKIDRSAKAGIDLFSS